MNEYDMLCRDIADEVASQFLDDVYNLEKEVKKLKEQIVLLEKDNTRLESFGRKWFVIAMDLIHERKSPKDYE